MVKEKVLLCAVGLAIFSSVTAFAFETNGDLDIGFNPGKFTNGQVQTALMQPDGKLVIAGGFGKVNGVARRNIARLNADGSLDLTFDPAGSTDGSIVQVIRQPADGKFIIVGGGTSAASGATFSTVNGTARNNIARLNSDGSLDLSFNPGALISADGVISGGLPSTPGTIFQAVLQSDGKIVVLGAFAAVATGPTTSAPRSCIARFDSAGIFDSGYNPGAGMTTADPNGPFAAFAARQSTDKVIVGGFFTQFDGNAVPGIVRLNTNGSYDATFNVGTGPDNINNMWGIYVQDDDQVMAFGNFSAYNGTLRNQIARLGANGALDTGFAPGVFTNYNSFVTIEAVIKQSDGRYLVGGLFYKLDGNAAGAVARLNSNGARDPGFDSTGTKTAGEVSCFVKRNTDDEYFVGGYFSSYGPEVRNNLVLIKTDGTNDSTLPLTTGVIDYNPQIFAISPQSDGKIVVGGLFSSVNGQPHYNLVRLNADGSTDSSFLTTLGASRSVRAFVRQSSGKLLVAGAFYGFDGVTRASVARLNNDGSPDLTFDAGLGAFINSVNAVTVDSADNVYVGGGFTTFNGVSRPNLVKLTPNGAVDLTFNPGLGPNGAINALAPPTATAGLVLGGSFNQYSGTTANRIARVNATTGALDTAFTTAGGTGFNSTVRALTLRGDGSYYAAGNFAAFNATARGRLARLASNGSLDTGFANPAMNLTPRCLIEQNNKINIAGNFTSPGQSARAFYCHRSARYDTCHRCWPDRFRIGHYFSGRI